MDRLRNFPLIKQYTAFQQHLIKKVVWPYSLEDDSVHRWRAHVLSSIMTATLFFGLIAYTSALRLIFAKKAWGLLVIDTSALLLYFIILVKEKIKFEVRASILLCGFFVIGVGVIISIGPLSGGPAWLFSFSVLAGVILGRKAAIVGVFMNATFLGICSYFYMKGYFGGSYDEIHMPHIISVLGNFIVINAVTAISVSALVKGVFKVYRNKEELAEILKKEQIELLEKKESLESEIYQRELAEKEIWKLSQFRESIIENANIWISVLDVKGNVVVWNKACEKISGYTKNEIVGNRKIWRYCFPDGKYRKKLLEKSTSAVKKNEVLEDYETTIIRRDGEKRILLWYIRSLVDNNDEIMGSIAIGRDITKRSLAEEEMRDARKVAGEHTELALIGQVAGKLAHDFNNILGIIMGNAELAVVGCEDSDMVNTLELILDQTVKGKNLTRNLVAFAKSQEPNQEFFQIRDKIGLVLSLLKKDLEGITIIREDQPDIPDLLADPGMIEHALVNLIQNSIHASSLKNDSKITVRTYRKKNYIFLEVLDNGCGIPKEHIKNIFIPSFTLKGSHDMTGSYHPKIKGTGYGMSNVSKYIRQHKGTIVVESEFGKFSKFVISLPVIEKELTRQEKKELKNERVYSNRKILLVEDEPSISTVLTKVLTSSPLNHTVDLATTGAHAIELFDSGKYDFISLDYLLNGEMNGMDVYKHIRKKDPNIPVLFLSGNIEFLESIKDLKTRDAFVDHLSKPSKNREYINAINALMSKSLVL